MAKVNKGLCIQYIKNNEILTNCYYENCSNIIEAFMILRNLIVGYNNSNLPVSDLDESLEAIRFFENVGSDIGLEERVKGVLRSLSMDCAILDFNDGFESSEYVEGLIGYDENDKALNEDMAKIVIYIYMDERKISTEDYEFAKKFYEEYKENLSVSDFYELDCFEFDINDFCFYDLEDIVEFMENYNSSFNEGERWFRIKGDEKFIYSFLN